jgi:proteasome lid subunit RPN8/RPN11
MKYLTRKIRQEIREHSLLEAPNECCGIIISKKGGVFESIKCKNSAPDKKGFFEIDPKDYLAASRIGKIKAYYHSHPKTNTSFSGADKAVSLASGLPLIMYAIKKNEFLEHSPT